MGLLDMFRKDSLITTQAKGAADWPAMASQEFPAGTVEYPVEMVDDLIRGMVGNARGMSPREMWRSQHNVRMVVDFLSRNIAQLGLHAYENAGEGGRERVRSGPLTDLLKAPNQWMTSYDLVASLVSDLALFDEAWWLFRPTRDGGHEIRPLPVHRVSVKSGHEWDGNLVVTVQQGDGRAPLTIRQENLIHFREWDPDYGKRVSPAIYTLRNVLAEQIASQEFRLKVWENGGQISSYITRPKDAADWSNESATRFREDISQYRAGKGSAGKMPVLEDGMEIKQTRFNAKDEQWAEAAQLALETVARTFHINPAMVGATGGISYANVKEFRKMLYGETLGPWLRMIQDRLNRFLVPRLTDVGGVYLEFNVKAKLSASFEEQAAVLSSAVGRPWMTANEARSLENMPALSGDAEQLVTPLNVLVGGQSSPLDADSTDGPKASTPKVKAVREPLHIKAEADSESSVMLGQIMTRFFARQKSAVLGKIGAGDDEWWDAERWNKELADDLFKVAVSMFGRVGADVLSRVVFDPDALDVGRAEAFLKAVSESRAQMINDATEDQLNAALDGDVTEGAERSTPEGVFEQADGSRGAVIAATLLTTLAAFTTTEAVKQVAGGRGMKTWNVQSSNPRASHAAMDGQTVPVDEPFSNGADWPGDPALGADGVSNCLCGVTVTIP